jgi:hypothetical protein
MDSALSVPRTLLHTRQVSCNGYARADGLWEVEGYLADVRSVDCRNKRGQVLVSAGDTLHGMRLRITVDQTLTIVDAHALTEHSPHGECRMVAAAYAGLTGLTIGPGFLAAAKTRFRGIDGCTHLTELIGPVVTTAIQTVISAKEQQAGSETDHADGQYWPQIRLVDSCHAWRRGGEAFNAHDNTPVENVDNLAALKIT